VSVGAQIVNLLLELKEKMALSTLFISHDLAVVSAVADRVAVMYAGRIVEEGPVAEIVTRPLHPYTAALLSAAGVPDAAGTRRRRIVLEGEPPRTASATAGCPFHPRCPIARPRCAGESPFPPSLRTDHPVACFFPGELAPDAPAPAGAPV
jgi:oligopeptide/dipeptide ABC transporter ATP-binding protein